MQELQHQPRMETQRKRQVCQPLDFSGVSSLLWVHLVPCGSGHATPGPGSRIMSSRIIVCECMHS